MAGCEWKGMRIQLWLGLVRQEANSEDISMVVDIFKALTIRTVFCDGHRRGKNLTTFKFSDGDYLASFMENQLKRASNAPQNCFHHGTHTQDETDRFMPRTIVMCQEDHRTALKT